MKYTECIIYVYTVIMLQYFSRLSTNTEYLVRFSYYFISYDI